MFTDTQKAELGKKLCPAAVKTRTQSGRTLSYVEGWHVIAEANRIFGFDGWTRETVDLRCVTEREREIGQNKVPGFSVTYIAKVRVTVGGIVREGCGTGHGIDRDLGQAHESALKEAETDAMKRALMTFGNPFGLALYDKEQANVGDEPIKRDDRITTGVEKTSPEAEDFMAKIDLCANEKALDTYLVTIADDVKSKLNERDRGLVHLRAKIRKKSFRAQQEKDAA